MSNLDPIRDLLRLLDEHLAIIDRGEDAEAKRKEIDLAIARTKRMLRAAPVLTDRPVLWVDGDSVLWIDEESGARIYDVRPRR